MVIAPAGLAAGLTAEIADWVSTAPPAPSRVQEWARHALLDWLGVTLAGSREPLAAMLREELAGEAGIGACTLLGALSRSNPTTRRWSTAPPATPSTTTTSRARCTAIRPPRWRRRCWRWPR